MSGVADSCSCAEVAATGDEVAAAENTLLVVVLVLVACVDGQLAGLAEGAVVAGRLALAALAAVSPRFLKKE